MTVQEATVEGKEVVITSKWRPIERHSFATEKEAQNRAEIINQAVSWLGTPFRNCTAAKGPAGGVDCAMLLVKSYTDAGILPPFDPRPYPPQWHIHHDEERFLQWVVDKLGGIEVTESEACIGDVCVYQFGRCYAHGAVIINKDEVCHAFYKSGRVVIMRKDESDIAMMKNKPRPVKYFKVLHV